MKLNKKSGFTLLEIIIVVIIIGVLSSLALPRFFRTVEYSRGAEALNTITAIRSALESYFLRSNTYVGAAFTTLAMDDPATMPNAHFTYGFGGLSATAYTITATRNAVDGGNGGTIAVAVNTAAVPPTVTRTGTTPFQGI